MVPSPIPPHNYVYDLVDNINPTPSTGSSPRSLQNGGNFTLFDGYLYFSADDGVNGRKLWKTNGSGIDTSLVRDIHLTGDGLQTSGYGAAIFMDELYFPASSGTSTELWKTDSTPAGTSQAFDASLLYDSITIVNFVHNDGLFFSTITQLPGGNTESNLWKRYWDTPSSSWQANHVGSIFGYPGFFFFLQLHAVYDDIGILFSG